MTELNKEFELSFTKIGYVQPTEIDGETKYFPADLPSGEPEESSVILYWTGSSLENMSTRFMRAVLPDNGIYVIEEYNQSKEVFCVAFNGHASIDADLKEAIENVAAAVARDERLEKETANEYVCQISDEAHERLKSIANEPSPTIAV